MLQTRFKHFSSEDKTQDKNSCILKENIHRVHPQEEEIFVLMMQLPPPSFVWRKKGLSIPLFFVPTLPSFPFLVCKRVTRFSIWWGKTFLFFLSVFPQIFVLFVSQLGVGCPVYEVLLFSKEIDKRIKGKIKTKAKAKNTNTNTWKKRTRSSV